MKQSPQIQFLGLDPSPVLDAEARDRLAKLDRFCPDLIAGRVTIELLHAHQPHGRMFAVRLDVTLPGSELTVSRVHDQDAHAALHHAFDGMTRQVQDAVRVVRERHERGAVVASDGNQA